MRCFSAPRSAAPLTRSLPRHLPVVICPRGPVPVIACQSRPASSAMRRAMGEIKVEAEVEAKTCSALTLALTSSAYARTSRSTIAPCGPVALTSASGTPSASARRRARGEMKSRDDAEVEVEVKSGSTSTLASASASITAIALSTFTTSPGCAVTRRSTPVAGASTSSVALSVSTAYSGSPAMTASPSMFVPTHQRERINGLPQRGHENFCGHECLTGD